MKQLLINVGDKVYIQSRHSMLELLCTVEIADSYTLKVKLPCTLYGNTHEIVQTKNARLKEPTQDKGQPKNNPHKNLIHNPFRKLISSLQAESKDEERIRKEAEAKSERKNKRLDIKAAAAHIQKNNMGLSNQELDFLEGLTKADQKAYLELLK